RRRPGDSDGLTRGTVPGRVRRPWLPGAATPVRRDATAWRWGWHVGGSLEDREVALQVRHPGVRRRLRLARSPDRCEDGAYPVVVIGVQQAVEILGPLHLVGYALEQATRVAEADQVEPAEMLHPGPGVHVGIEAGIPRHRVGLPGALD